MSQTKIVGIIIVLLVLAGVAGALLRKSSTPVTNTPILQSQESAASSSAPSLARQVRLSTDLSPDAQRILTSNIKKLQASLARNYDNYGDWMDLAIRYKMAGDYDGAREIWEYISYIHPSEPVSLHNLGDLYAHYLKDYPKAEDYYKQAIDAEPTQAIHYLALFDLYRYSYKQNTNAAVDILKLGIPRVVGNEAIDMYTALGSYYQDKKDSADAIIYFTKARDGAQKAGNTALVGQLDAQLAELKKQYP